MQNPLSVQAAKIALLEAELATLREQRQEEMCFMGTQLTKAQTVNINMQNKMQAQQKQIDTYEQALVTFEKMIKEIEIGRSQYRNGYYNHHVEQIGMYGSATHPVIGRLVANHYVGWELPRINTLGNLVKSPREQLLYSA